MKRKFVTLLLALSIATISITACGNKTDNNTETTEMVNEIESLPWLQLSSLETHPELRQAFDNRFNITGETGNKVGSIYYNTDTEKADQNVTLYMVLKNTSTRNAFINAASMEALGNIALDNYVDIEETDASAPYAAINAYFELLPDQADGQFDGDATISRAQAMALLMRATTQVNEAGAPEVNKDFTSVVGESQYTDFAAPMNDYAYINTSNGLNKGSFITSMTKGEYICMVTNYILADYEAELAAQGFVDVYADKDVTISVVNDAGNIYFADAISDASKGVPSDMYSVFVKAVKYDLLTEDDLQDWESSLTKQDAIEILTTMTLNYTSSSGAGQGLYDEGYKSEEQLSEEERKEQEQIALYEFAATLPGDENPNIKLHKWAQSQGADGMQGWYLIYEHGSGAGDNPTYAICVNPDSEYYNQVFHVGDILPYAGRLDGTWEEEDALSTEKAKQNVEEAGGSVYTDPETGKTIWDIP